MGGGYLSNAGTFLVETLFGLYLLALLLRLLLQQVRADFYNPLSQFLVKVTNPPLRPLRRFIPGLGGVDMASIVLLLLLKAIELILVGLLRGYPTPNFLGLFALASAELVSLTVYVFLIAIFIQAILSWINPGGYNPAVSLLHQLTEPLLRPARRYIPPISGLDLSPMAVIIGLYLVILLLVQPLQALGWSLTYPGLRPLILQ